MGGPAYELAAGTPVPFEKAATTILNRGRLRVVEHFVDQRQLAILDPQLLGARAEEAVFEVLVTKLDQSLISHHRPKETDC